ncbi:MAG: amidohydrolase family protein [Lachnospiraceae bacterium]|nr:amidohydrolase family protein [Lachnospiraceae bacterium]MDY5540188.1 amidohydrolase family protein [Lachnospiraceae bacterium]
MGLTIDINTHPYLFSDVCDTEEKERFAIEITGLYHSGVGSMASQFARLDCAKIDRCVLSPLDLTTTRGRWLNTNEEVKTLEEKYPDRFIGFASVDPRREDAAEVLEDAFTRLGLKGLYIFPALQDFNPKEAYMKPLFEVCLKYDRPIISDCGCSPYPGLLTTYAHPMLWEETALRYPKLRICLTRFGWPWNREVCMLMLRYRNIYTDTSIIYLDDSRQMYHQMFEVDMGPKWIDRGFRHQVMFGSGDPGLEQIRQVNAIRALNYRESTLENILGKNALEFMGFEKEMRWVND